MKQLLVFLISCTFLCTLSGVLCEKATAPAFTAGIENVMPRFDGVTFPDGAIGSPNVNFDLTHIGFATAVVDLRLAKIHWCHDEWFYSMGYKARLNGTVDELIAPPDVQNLNPEYPLKYC